MTDHALPETRRRGLYETTSRRRDMRSFLPDPIPAETLARILLTAHQAGSVGLSQPWNFLVVENREVRRQVRAHVEAERRRAAETFEPERREKYLSFKLEGILDAGINLCVTCDLERFGPWIIGRNTIPETSAHSTCCAAQNLWLAARAEGVGVGWVSLMEPTVFRTIPGIQDRIVPVAYLCVGFVESFPDRPCVRSGAGCRDFRSKMWCFMTAGTSALGPTSAVHLKRAGLMACKPHLRPPASPRADPNGDEPSGTFTPVCLHRHGRNAQAKFCALAERMTKRRPVKYPFGWRAAQGWSSRTHHDPDHDRAGVRTRRHQTAPAHLLCAAGQRQGACRHGALSCSLGILGSVGESQVPGVITERRLSIEHCVI